MASALMTPTDSTISYAGRTVPTSPVRLLRTNKSGTSLSVGEGRAVEFYRCVSFHILSVSHQEGTKLLSENRPGILLTYL